MESEECHSCLDLLDYWVVVTYLRPLGEHVAVKSWVGPENQHHQFVNRFSPWVEHWAL